MGAGPCVVVSVMLCVLQVECSLPVQRRLCLCICDCFIQGICYAHISAEGIKSIMISYASQCILIHLYTLERCYTLQYYEVELGSCILHVVFGLFRHSISVFIIFFFSLKHDMSTADVNAFFPNLHVSTGDCIVHVKSI